MKKNFIPANMPGCQMMSNFNYIPAQPEMYRCQLSYIPVSSSASLGPNGTTPNTREFKEYKLSWWEKDSFFQYPTILISAFYGMKWADNFREHFNIPDDFIIMGDSGGFQNFTQNADLNPIDVLRWQEKHCQIGLTFDYPVGIEDSESDIKNKQKKTVENAYIAVKNKKNKNLKLYAVLQGHTYNQLKNIMKMYNEEGNINEFDGFAVGGIVSLTSNLNHLTSLLLTTVELLKEYKKPIHFLGMSGYNIIPFIAWLHKKYNLPITFDSASYGSGAIRKQYYINMQFKLDFGEFSTSIKKLPCNCPICRNLNVEEFKKLGSISGGLISLHNLYKTIEYVETIYSLIEDESDFIRYIDKYYKPEVAEAIKRINYTFENGIEKAMEKYDIHQVQVAHKTRNLFSF